MDTNKLQLNEEQRNQLDGIVQKMVSNKESDSAIQYVVNDFKEKYATKPPGFFQSLVQTIASPVLGQLSSFRAIGGTLAAQTPEEIEKASKKEYDYGYFGKAKPLTTPKEGFGAGVNIGLTLASGGTGSLAKSVGATGLKNLAIRTGESAIIGGGLQASSNLQKGKKLTEGVGLSTVIGGAIPVVGTGLSSAKSAILSKATPTAETFINSLIKPLQKDFAYGKNPARGILNEGIVAKDFDDLTRKVVDRRNLVGQEIGTIGEQIDKSGITLNLVPALNPINSAIDKAAKANNTTLFNSLNNVKTALLNDLKSGVDEKGLPTIVKGGDKNLISAGYNEARQFLNDISTHTRFTGNPSDDKALNIATKQAYGIVRNIMNETADKVNPTLGKQIRNLNERYGDLLSAENAINHRELVLKRQNILNLADRFAIPVSIASSIATGLMTGDFSKAGIVLLAQLGTIAGTKALGSTYSKTSIAQFLSRLPQAERQGILNSTPVLKNWYERVTGKVSPGETAPKTKALQYVENPKVGLSVGKVKITPELKDGIISELRRLDTTPLTINGRPDLSDPDIMFRLSQLKDKAMDYKNFSNDELQETLSLLQKIGINLK